MSEKNSCNADGSSSASWIERLVDGLLSPNTLLAASFVVAVVVFVPKLTRVLPDLRGSEQYRMSSSEIEVPPTPRWVPRHFVEQVLTRAELPNELSLLDETLVPKIANAFERHPWVKGKVKVRASIPARLTVELEYREPVAMVRVKNGVLPIDVEGVLLPSRDFSSALAAEFPTIEGVSSSPPHEVGTVWNDTGVLGAAQLAALLKPHWQEFGFQRLKVATASSKFTNDETNLQLLTAGGSRVIWGRPPQSRHPGELPAEKKLERIKFYLKHHGPFDSPHGPFEFDITHWRDISRKPIAAADPAARQ